MCNEWNIEHLKSCIENTYDVENFRELTPDELLTEIQTY